jgi:chromosome segregation ATPase
MKPKLIAAGLVLVALTAGASGQAPVPASSNPSYDALLAEVRGLRAELNQVAGTSIRTQLLVGRLQLQEQRITIVSKQLDEARTMLATMPAGLPPMQNQLKQLETEARDPMMTQERRQAMDYSITHAKAQIEMMQKQIAALTEKESTLSATLASEQSHWYEFNNRLDEIERELGRSAR